MIIAIAIGVLIFTFLTLVLFGHGYINTVEWIAWKLKVHARKVRIMHQRRAAVMNERWVGDLETNE